MPRSNAKRAFQQNFVSLPLMFDGECSECFPLRLDASRSYLLETAYFTSTDAALLRNNYGRCHMRVPPPRYTIPPRALVPTKT